MPPAGSRALDVGTGSGFVMAVLGLLVGGSMVGMDHIPELVALARKNVTSDPQAKWEGMRRQRDET
jgi:protein-L-isoaspartate(D-aspartate) O-methyltransferase